MATGEGSGSDGSRGSTRQSLPKAIKLEQSRLVDCHGHLTEEPKISSLHFFIRCTDRFRAGSTRLMDSISSRKAKRFSVQAHHDSAAAESDITPGHAWHLFVGFLSGR